MPVILYNAFANALVEAAAAAIEAGAGNPTLLLYQGTQPVVNGSVTGGTLIASYDLAANPFPASGGAAGFGATLTATTTPITVNSAAAFDFSTGGYGVMRNGDTDVQYTGLVGIAGSGAEFEVSPFSGSISTALTLSAINLTIPQTSS